jgi:hypothetical protein
MTHHRLTRIATVTLTIATVAAPTAMARQDLRSPDAKDARAAVTQSRHAQPTQDLRSSDARDAADGRGTFSAPDVTVVKIARPAAAPASGGLDWGDAGIGAGAVLGLLLVALGGVLGVIHRRQVAQRRHQTAAA